MLGIVSPEPRVAEGDGILSGVRHWNPRSWNVDPRVFLGSVLVMKPFLAKKNCIFCPVDVWVHLVELGPTQNHANTPNIGPQESVLTIQNVFKTVPDLDHCNMTLVDFQEITSYC